MTKRETIWERGIVLPQSGPIQWLLMYLAFVTMVGFGIWWVLDSVSPHELDVASGHIYRVPGYRRSPDFFVTKFDAYALRIAVAHFAAFVAIAGPVGFFNLGRKHPSAADGPPPPHTPH